MNAGEVEANILRTLHALCDEHQQLQQNENENNSEQQQQRFARPIRQLRDAYDSLAMFLGATPSAQQLKQQQQHADQQAASSSSALPAAEQARGTVDLSARLLRFADLLVDKGMYFLALHSPLAELTSIFVEGEQPHQKQQHHAARTSPLYALRVRYRLLVLTCNFFSVLAEDDRLERPTSFDGCIAAAKSLTDVGIECLRHPDDHYYLVFNSTVMLVRCCLALMHRGYHAQCTVFLAWCCRACDSVIQLATTKRLGWRVRLYGLLALCFESMGDYATALSVAKQLQLRVSELVALESLDIVPPTPAQRAALAQAQQQAAQQVLVYGMMLSSAGAHTHAHALAVERFYAEQERHQQQQQQSHQDGDDDKHAAATLMATTTLTAKQLQQQKEQLAAAQQPPIPPPPPAGLPAELPAPVLQPQDIVERVKATLAPVVDAAASSAGSSSSSSKGSFSGFPLLLASVVSVAMSVSQAACAAPGGEVARPVVAALATATACAVEFYCDAYVTSARQRQQLAATVPLPGVLAEFAAAQDKLRQHREGAERQLHLSDDAQQTALLEGGSGNTKGSKPLTRQQQQQQQQKNAAAAAAATSSSSSSGAAKRRAGQQDGALQQLQSASASDVADELFAIFSAEAHFDTHSSELFPLDSLLIVALRFLAQRPDKMELTAVLAAVVQHRATLVLNAAIQASQMSGLSGNHHSRRMEAIINEATQCAAVSRLLHVFRRVQTNLQQQQQQQTSNNNRLNNKNNNNNANEAQKFMLLDELAYELNVAALAVEKHPVKVHTAHVAGGAVSGPAWSCDVIQNVAGFLWHKCSSASDEEDSDKKKRRKVAAIRTGIVRPIVRALVLVNHSDALQVAHIALGAFGDTATLRELLVGATEDDLHLDESILVLESALRFVCQRQTSYIAAVTASNKKISNSSSVGEGESGSDGESMEKATPHLWFRELRDARTELWRVLCRLLVRRMVWRKFRASCREHDDRVRAMEERHHAKAHLFGKPTMKQQTLLAQAKHLEPELLSIATDVTSDSATLQQLSNHPVVASSAAADASETPAAAGSALFRAVAMVELAANASAVPTQHKLYSAAHSLITTTAAAAIADIARETTRKNSGSSEDEPPSSGGNNSLASTVSARELDDYFSRRASDASPVLVASYLVAQLSVGYTPGRNFAFTTNFVDATSLIESAFAREPFSSGVDSDCDDTAGTTATRTAAPALRGSGDNEIVPGIAASKRLRPNDAFIKRCSVITLRGAVDALTGAASMSLRHCEVNDTAQSAQFADDTQLGGELDPRRGARASAAQAEALGALEQCTVAASVCVAIGDARRCIKTVFVAARCMSAVVKHSRDRPLALLRSLPVLLNALLSCTATPPASGGANKGSNSSSNNIPAPFSAAASANPWADDALQLVVCRMLQALYETVVHVPSDRARRQAAVRGDFFFNLFLAVWQQIAANPCGSVVMHVGQLEWIAERIKFALLGIEPAATGQTSARGTQCTATGAGGAGGGAAAAKGPGAKQGTPRSGGADAASAKKAGGAAGGGGGGARGMSRAAAAADAAALRDAATGFEGRVVSLVAALTPSSSWAGVAQATSNAVQSSVQQQQQQPGSRAVREQQQQQQQQDTASQQLPPTAPAVTNEVPLEWSHLLETVFFGQLAESLLPALEQLLAVASGTNNNTNANTGAASSKQQQHQQQQQQQATTTTSNAFLLPPLTTEVLVSLRPLLRLAVVVQKATAADQAPSIAIVDSAGAPPLLLLPAQFGAAQAAQIAAAAAQQAQQQYGRGGSTAAAAAAAASAASGADRDAAAAGGGSGGAADGSGGAGAGATGAGGAGGGTMPGGGYAEVEISIWDPLFPMLATLAAEACLKRQSQPHMVEFGTLLAQTALNGMAVRFNVLREIEAESTASLQSAMDAYAVKFIQAHGGSISAAAAAISESAAGGGPVPSSGGGTKAGGGGVGGASAKHQQLQQQQQAALQEQLLEAETMSLDGGVIAAAARALPSALDRATLALTRALPMLRRKALFARVRALQRMSDVAYRARLHELIAAGLAHSFPSAPGFILAQQKRAAALAAAAAEQQQLQQQQSAAAGAGVGAAGGGESPSAATALQQQQQQAQLQQYTQQRDAVAQSLLRIVAHYSRAAVLYGRTHCWARNLAVAQSTVAFIQRVFRLSSGSPPPLFGGKAHLTSAAKDQQQQQQRARLLSHRSSRDSMATTDSAAAETATNVVEQLGAAPQVLAQVESLMRVLAATQLHCMASLEDGLYNGLVSSSVPASSSFSSTTVDWLYAPNFRRWNLDQFQDRDESAHSIQIASAARTLKAASNKYLARSCSLLVRTTPASILAQRAEFERFVVGTDSLLRTKVGELVSEEGKRRNECVDEERAETIHAVEGCGLSSLQRFVQEILDDMAQEKEQHEAEQSARKLARNNRIEISGPGGPLAHQKQPSKSRNNKNNNNNITTSTSTSPVAVARRQARQSGGSNNLIRLVDPDGGDALLIKPPAEEGSGGVLAIERRGVPLCELVACFHFFTECMQYNKRKISAIAMLLEANERTALRYARVLLPTAIALTRATNKNPAPLLEQLALFDRDESRLLKCVNDARAAWKRYRATDAYATVESNFMLRWSLGARERQHLLSQPPPAIVPQPAQVAPAGAELVTGSALETLQLQFGNAGGGSGSPTASATASVAGDNASSCAVVSGRAAVLPVAASVAAYTTPAVGAPSSPAVLPTTLLRPIMQLYGSAVETLRAKQKRTRVSELLFEMGGIFFTHNMLDDALLAWSDAADAALGHVSVMTKFRQLLAAPHRTTIDGTASRDDDLFSGVGFWKGLCGAGSLACIARCVQLPNSEAGALDACMLAAEIVRSFSGSSSAALPCDGLDELRPYNPRYQLFAGVSLAADDNGGIGAESPLVIQITDALAFAATFLLEHERPLHAAVVARCAEFLALDAVRSVKLAMVARTVLARAAAACADLSSAFYYLSLVVRGSAVPLFAAPNSANALATTHAGAEACFDILPLARRNGGVFSPESGLAASAFSAASGKDKQGGARATAAASTAAAGANAAGGRTANAQQQPQHHPSPASSDVFHSHFCDPLLDFDAADPEMALRAVETLAALVGVAITPEQLQQQQQYIAATAAGADGGQQQQKNIRVAGGGAASPKDKDPLAAAAASAAGASVPAPALHSAVAAEYGEQLSQYCVRSVLEVLVLIGCSMPVGTLWSEIKSVAATVSGKGANRSSENNNNNSNTITNSNTAASRAGGGGGGAGGDSAAAAANLLSPAQLQTAQHPAANSFGATAASGIGATAAVFAHSATELAERLVLALGMPTSRHAPEDPLIAAIAATASNEKGNRGPSKQASSAAAGAGGGGAAGGKRGKGDGADMLGHTLSLGQGAEEDPRLAVWLRLQAARLARSRGHICRARDLLLEAIETHAVDASEGQSLDAPHAPTYLYSLRPRHVVACYMDLAELHLLLRRPVAAQQTCRDGLALAGRVNNRRDAAQLHALLAQCHQMTGSVKLMHTALDEATAMFKRVEYKHSLGAEADSVICETEMYASELQQAFKFAAATPNINSSSSSVNNTATKQQMVRDLLRFAARRGCGPLLRFLPRRRIAFSATVHCSIVRALLHLVPSFAGHVDDETQLLSWAGQCIVPSSSVAAAAAAVASWPSPSNNNNNNSIMVPQNIHPSLYSDYLFALLEAQKSALQQEQQQQRHHEGDHLATSRSLITSIWACELHSSHNFATLGSSLSTFVFVAAMVLQQRIADAHHAHHQKRRHAGKSSANLTKAEQRKLAADAGAETERQIQQLLGALFWLDLLRLCQKQLFTLADYSSGAGLPEAIIAAGAGAAGAADPLTPYFVAEQMDDELRRTQNAQTLFSNALFAASTADSNVGGGGGKGGAKGGGNAGAGGDAGKARRGGKDDAAAGGAAGGVVAVAGKISTIGLVQCFAEMQRSAAAVVGSSRRAHMDQAMSAIRRVLLARCSAQSLSSAWRTPVGLINPDPFSSSSTAAATAAQQQQQRGSTPEVSEQRQPLPLQLPPGVVRSAAGGHTVYILAAPSSSAASCSTVDFVIVVDPEAPSGPTPAEAAATAAAAAAAASNKDNNKKRSPSAGSKQQQPSTTPSAPTSGRNNNNNSVDAIPNQPLKSSAIGGAAASFHSAAKPSIAVRVVRCDVESVQEAFVELKSSVEFCEPPKIVDPTAGGIDALTAALREANIAIEGNERSAQGGKGADKTASGAAANTGAGGGGGKSSGAAVASSAAANANAAGESSQGGKTFRNGFIASLSTLFSGQKRAAARVAASSLPPLLFSPERARFFREALTSQTVAMLHDQHLCEWLYQSVLAQPQ